MSRWRRQQEKRARRAKLMLDEEKIVEEKVVAKCGPLLTRMVALQRRNPRLGPGDAMLFAAQELRVKIPTDFVEPLIRVALRRLAQ